MQLYSLLWISPLFFAKLLKEKVNEEDAFVLLFDESLNFITKNKQLDVFVRFWDGDKVVTRYWMSQFVGHATAEDLLEHINKSTEALYLQKLIQVCMMIMIKGLFIFFAGGGGGGGFCGVISPF